MDLKLTSICAILWGGHGSAAPSSLIFSSHSALNWNMGEEGTKKRPIMLHRVCFGSIERFIGILIEHFAGKFPVWLAPVQVKVIPVSEKSMDYANGVMRAEGGGDPHGDRPQG